MAVEVGRIETRHDPGGGPIDWHPNDAGMQGYADLFWDAMGPEVEG